MRRDRQGGTKSFVLGEGGDFGLRKANICKIRFCIQNMFVLQFI